GGGEHDPGAERAREKAGQRNGDDLGHQIGGLHPGDFVGRGGEAGLYLRERGGYDLDVEEGHEHPEAHGQEGDDARGIDMLDRGRRGGRQTRGSYARRGAHGAISPCDQRVAVLCSGAGAPLSAEAVDFFVLTLTTTDIPGRSTPSW